MANDLIEETADTASQESIPDAASPPPGTVDAWQKHLATLPAKDVLALLNEDKARANRLLAGFRPTGDALKNPRVSGRIADEAMKQPKFAQSLLALAPKSVPQEKEPTTTRTAPATAAREIENLKKETVLLRESLDKRKAVIQQKEMEVRELKAALLRTEHERDASRNALQQSREAHGHAETEIERLRHQLRRMEERGKKETPAEPSRPLSPAAGAVVSRAISASPAVNQASPLADGAERLLRRGRYLAVAELCRETLNTEAAKENTLERGRTHALYAAALYGQGDIASGEEQSRAALQTLLDGGDIPGAAEAAVRFLREARSIRKTDGELLRRLVTLARRAGLVQAIAAPFRQLRLRSRSGYQRLVEILGSAGKDILPQSVSSELIGPDQPVVLPAYNAQPLTPRRVVQAVDAGETELIGSVRQGIAALRQIGLEESRRADAFLEAIAAVDSAAIEPLLRPTTGPVIVDASNVARFNPDPLAFSLSEHTEHLRLMRDFLLRSGFFPILMIADANLIYKIDNRAAYQVMLSREIVREVPAGTSADDEIIRQAQLWNAPVVTNDTFSDREDVFELTRLGFHILQGIIGLIPR